MNAQGESLGRILDDHRLSQFPSQPGLEIRSESQETHGGEVPDQANVLSANRLPPVRRLQRGRVGECFARDTHS